jgi:hypothetical protein
MTDDQKIIDIPVAGPSTIEIDAERIERIILSTCHSSATRAANQIHLAADGQQ